jgi:hypothetical protein
VESSAVCPPTQFKKDGAVTFEADCVVGCATQVEDPLDERERAEDDLALVLEMEAVLCDIDFVSRGHDVLRKGVGFVFE